MMTSVSESEALATARQTLSACRSIFLATKAPVYLYQMASRPETASAAENRLVDLYAAVASATAFPDLDEVRAILEGTLNVIGVPLP